MENGLIILENWFLEQCNGDWEHNYQIKIATIDNPGWSLTVDLVDTDYENIEDYFYKSIVHEDNDWFFIAIKNGQFEATGDSHKLRLLIEKFWELVVNRETSAVTS